ncbi:T9SS type B sorting domain-containing protein [Psychroflexus aurantiacus]|uniref:T9SS type B sorting domain-containing protein n=1 Tax=Psychroflexus aurantiacus TaxID=2709310 RepID=UPI0013DBAF48|nr:T9SS type B sorting domain-containing protein [Psychroflexus aurantiacus]
MLICLSSVSFYAQGQADNWYFGRNAGITFNTNPPTALSDGQLNTLEGCSSISDSDGNLLMYTDGRTIWNRNHQIMPNADYFAGRGLKGDPSSTSSGLIVPHPTNPNLYFVFTVDEPHHENANAYPNQGPADANGNPISEYTDTEQGVPEADDGFNNGLNYSIVNMALNGGLGDVIPGQKNKELITYDPNDAEEVKYKASEKITAVRGRDCNSVWVITQFRNKFYAFLIDAGGVDDEPVISEVPPLLEVSNYRRAAIGYLKASPQGDKLLIAHNTSNYNPVTDANLDDGNVYLYDFNNLTGEVSNPIELIENVNAYGVEFSQDSRKAYATVRDTSTKIYQWNLDAADIPNSIETISNSNETTSALQLGPDGKIYHSLINTFQLGVINNPNEIGAAANYTQNISEGAIALNGNIATFGLPPFIQSLFSQRVPIVETDNEEVIEQVSLCDTYTYQLGYEDIPGATYTWSKDGTVLPGETSHILNISQNPSADFPVEHNYRLEVDLNNGDCPFFGIATILFNQSPAFEDDKLLTCKEEGSDAVFDLTEVVSKLSEQVEMNPEEFDIELYRNSTDAETGTNPIAVSADFINTENLNSISVKVKTNTICEKLVEFKLTNRFFPDVDVTPEVLIYCTADFPETLSLEAIKDNEDASRYEYLWSTGETGPSIEINSAGDYFVDIRFIGEDCMVTKPFEIEESQPAFESETIRLCDTFQHTLEQNTFENGVFTWFQNGNRMTGENTSALTVNVQQDAEFPVSDTYTLEVDLLDGSCIKTFDYNLIFNKSPDYNSVVLQSCNNPELGYATFNLEEAISQLTENVNEVSPDELSLEFYESESDALDAENPILNPQNFENTSNLSRIFGIVESFESCINLVEIELSTFLFPNVSPEATALIYCLEDFPETIQLSALIDGNTLSNYDFLWSTSETSQAIEVNQAGIYTVEISDPTFGCSLIKEFEVRESDIADFESSVEHFSDLNNSIEIIIDPSNLGDYEFAIEEPLNFQDSNRFENLVSGIYKVYVRDKFGCGISEKTIGVLGIMKFFTPNGDGNNDIWEISGLLENNQEDILLQIYDRYGKLMRSFTNKDAGWDGTYNGKNMPSDDYWYRIRLTDGTIETGSFTLKR